MEKMNNSITFIEILNNNRNVRKQRHINLVIQYQHGLIQEYQMNYDRFLDVQRKKYDEYLNEDLRSFQIILDGEHQNDRIRTKKLASFDQKAYWNRRRIKTLNLKIHSVEKTNELLNEYDQKALIARNEFINQLNTKYPHLENDKALIAKTTEKVNALKAKREKQEAKIINKHQQICKKLEVQKEKIKASIKKLESKHVLLAKKIDLFNERDLKYNESKLVGLKQEIGAVNANNQIKPAKKFAKALKIQTAIDKIETKLKLHKEQDIQLSVKNLKMYFGGVKAVNDLSFDVKKGEVYGLIGPNGAGKTTVFNCLTQFYKATAGSMMFRNKEAKVVDLYNLKTHDMISEGIARSFQNVELIWELTVLDNLLVASHSLLTTTFIDHMAHDAKMIREEKVLRTKGMQVLINLGIAEYAFRSPYGLPYGILKKVELARTLMTDPSLIILDEPAAGLNDTETADLAKVIKKINQDMGITIFLVEHDMGLVMSICDRICAISFGKKIGEGTPIEIQNNPEVRKAYLGDDSDE